MSSSRILVALALSAASISCVSYSSIQKTDKEVYLSGGTNYWFINVPFLKRCEVDGQILHCEELKEFEARSSKAGGAGGEAAPASSAAPAQSAAPAKPEPAKK
jgi:hypothetical protein